MSWLALSLLLTSTPFSLDGEACAPREVLEREGRALGLSLVPEAALVVRFERRAALEFELHVARDGSEVLKRTLRGTCEEAGAAAVVVLERLLRDLAHQPARAPENSTTPPPATSRSAASTPSASPAAKAGGRTTGAASDRATAESRAARNTSTAGFSADAGVQGAEVTSAPPTEAARSDEVRAPPPPSDAAPTTELAVGPSGEATAPAPFSVRAEAPSAELASRDAARIAEAAPTLAAGATAAPAGETAERVVETPEAPSFEEWQVLAGGGVIGPTAGVLSPLLAIDGSARFGQRWRLGALALFSFGSDVLVVDQATNVLRGMLSTRDVWVLLAPAVCTDGDRPRVCAGPYAGLRAVFAQASGPYVFQPTPRVSPAFTTGAVVDLTLAVGRFRAVLGASVLVTPTPPVISLEALPTTSQGSVVEGFGTLTIGLAGPAP